MDRNDLMEQQISLNKLREFHSVLKEQDEMNRKKFSMISLQLVHLRNQLKISVKSLQQTNENLMKYKNVRSILGRMIVRRVNLCQLLYKKLARIEKFIHQHDERVQMICKCIHSLKIQIRQIQNETKKLLQRKDQFQFEVKSYFSIEYILSIDFRLSIKCLIILIENNKSFDDIIQSNIHVIDFSLSLSQNKMTKFYSLSI